MQRNPGSTTDVGLACFMFLSVYVFYRFVKSPSAVRLIVAGISVGLVLAVKHTGLLVFPILFFLTLCEIIFNIFGAIKQYLDQRGVKECWFVYFAEGVAEPSYYGIPCKPLPTINTLWLNLPIDVPPSIDGPVLISSSNLSGLEFGPESP